MKAIKEIKTTNQTAMKIELNYLNDFTMYKKMNGINLAINELRGWMLFPECL